MMWCLPGDFLLNGSNCIDCSFPLSLDLEVKIKSWIAWSGNDWKLTNQWSFDFGCKEVRAKNVVRLWQIPWKGQICNATEVKCEDTYLRQVQLCHKPQLLCLHWPLHLCLWSTNAAHWHSQQTFTETVLIDLPILTWASLVNFNALLHSHSSGAGHTDLSALFEVLRLLCNFDIAHVVVSLLHFHAAPHIGNLEWLKLVCEFMKKFEHVAIQHSKEIPHHENMFGE